MKILKSYLGKLEKNKRTLLYRVVFVTSALVVGGVLVSFLTSDATAGWWDEGWLHRKQINFGNSGSPQSNKIVSFTEDTATLIADGKMQTGCQDVRFVDNTGRPLEHRIGYQPDIQYVPGSATEYNSTTGASSYTFSHTVNSGSNQLLTVIVHAQDTAAINVTNVTFNSDSMTEQIEVDHNDGTNHYVTSIWTLVNPDVTSANVQVTYSASVDRHVASAMNFTGVDQTTPVGVVESNTSSSASSIGITDTTSYANSVLVGGGTRKVNEISPSRRIYTLLPGKHVYEEQTGTTTSNISAGGGFQYAETPGSHTMTFGLSNATSDTHMAGAFIELKQAAGCNSTVTNIEVLMPNIDSGESAVYMYYGNPSASNSASSLTDSSKTLAYKEVSSSSDSTDFGSLSTLSYSHTVTAGTNQTLVVVTDQLKQQSGDVPVDVTSVTYNGKPMVRQVFADGTSTNRNGSTEVWTLLNPDVGNNQVAITLSETNTVLVSAAMTFENTRQNYFPAAGAAFESSSTSFNINITTTKPNTLLAGGGARQRSTTAPNATTATVNVTSPGTRVYHVLQANPAIASSISSAGGHQSAVGAGVHTMNLTTSSPSNQFMTGALIALEPESSYDTFSPTSGPATAGEEKGPGPVGYWKFDEGYGTTANNSIANAYNGNISGGLWQTEDMCVNGKCLYFDGSDDVVTVTNAQAIDFDEGLNDGVSASFWVRPLSDGESDTGRIFAKGTRFYCQTENESGGKVDLRCFIDLASTDPAVVVSGALTIGHWHHVLATYGDDGDDDLLIYIDGQLRGTGNGSGSPASGDSDNLLIGGGTSNNFHGFIDDFKIYSYERGEAQARTDAIRGASASGSTASLGIVDTGYLNHGLAGYWKLDHTSGNATDYSGFGRTLTNNGTTTYVTGKFGAGSEHVPASSQHFSTGTTINGIQSVSFWVNPDTTTTYYVSLTSSAYITSSSGTLSATGFTNPRIFVNGVETSTIVADAWQLVTVTTDTPINANQLYLGRQGSNYFDGTFDELRLYNRQIDSGEIARLYSWGPSPIGYWPLDENTGTSTTFDRSGNGYNGTMASFTENSWVPGKVGSGLQFNGSSTSIATSSSINLANESFTVSAWFKRATIGAYHFIISQGTASSNQGLHFGYRDNNQLTCDFWGNALNTSAFTDTEWHHIVCTYNAVTNERILYRDGVTVASDISAADFSGTGTFTIGYRNFSTIYANGTIDEVKVYNYPRTSAQVIEDMNGGHPTTGSSMPEPIAWWRLDEMNGTTVNDASGNSNTGTITAGSGGWAPGKISGGYQFDNANTLINAGSAAILDDIPATGLSLSTWVYPTGLGEGSLGFIVAKNSGTTPSSGWILRINGTYALTFTVDGSTDLVRSTSNNVLTQNAWNHVLVSWDGVITTAASAKIFVNGVETPYATTTNGASRVSDAASNLYIGNSSTSARTFSGVIDDVKIYNTALTADQIKVDYNARSALNAGTGVNEADNIVDGAGNPPVGWWKLDENTGTTANDHAGNSNTGTITAGTGGWSPGKVGQAYQFDGASTSINAGSATILDDMPATGLSLSTWVYPTGLGESSLGFIVAKNSGTTPSSGWILRINGTYALTFTVDGSTDLVRSTNNNVLTQNAWNHVAVSWDGVITTAASARIYVNGIEATYATTTNGASRVSDAASNLYIGNDSSGARTFAGMIDDVKVYSYGRTPAQVAYDYNRGAPIAWYRFDECQGTTINDATGHGFVGTLTIGGSGTYTSPGTCGSGTGTHAWNAGTVGKLDSAMAFDGTNDYITTSPSVNLANSSFTLSAWYKRGSIGSHHFIIGQGTNSTNQGLHLGYRNTNVLACDFWGNTLDTSAAYTDTDWHHIVCNYNVASGERKLYRDGVLVASDAGVAAFTGTGDFNIGRRPMSVIYANGLIDDVRIYNYALSAAQVRTVFNGGAVRME